MSNQVGVADEKMALAVACPNCRAAAGKPCIGWKASDSGINERSRGPHPERIAAGRGSSTVGMSDPPPIDSAEISKEIGEIRRSLVSSGKRATARSNIAIRLAKLEARLEGGPGGVRP